MNGVHDMGGMHGFGRVDAQADEPPFHAAWEGRALAMNRAMGHCGLWNIDISRFSRESLPPAMYLSSSYYRKWHYALEDLLVQYGLVGQDELDAGHALHPARPVTQILTFDQAAVSLSAAVWVPSNTSAAVTSFRIPPRRAGAKTHSGCTR